MTFIIASFVAGLLTFFAPCTLPLVPGYLGFISGVSPKDLENPETAVAARKKIFKNGIFFVIGFSSIFIFFGAIFGGFTIILEAFGIVVSAKTMCVIEEWLGRIGGVVVILFGLFMLGVFKLKMLQVDRRMKMPSFLEVGKPSSSLVIGGAFAFGWTPCVGPILGTILTIAATEGSILQGALLLAVFSAGLAIPFILIAAGISHATKYINAISKYLKWVSIIGGILLIFLGVLLITGNFALLNSWAFQFLGGYEELILDYL